MFRDNGLTSKSVNLDKTIPSGWGDEVHRMVMSWYENAYMETPFTF